jgi:zinc finger SWIM domain-containing protein 3
LFFAHFNGIALANNYPEVLLIDATYKTNIYNMPLLHFAGITPTSKTFSIGFAFMSSESEAIYQWVLSQFQSHIQGDQLIPTIIITDNEGALLNTLSAIFPNTPHLLYRWYAEKNVLIQANECWRTTGVSEAEKKENTELRDQFIERWQEVVRAKTEEAFEDLYAKLKNDYSKQVNLLAYLDKYKYSKKELFAVVWSNQLKHYSIIVTSRIEGAHSCLKALLHTSRNDLLEVVKVIEQMHETQYSEIRANLASQRDRILYDINAKYNQWIDPGINTKIIPKALRLAKQ